MNSPHRAQLVDPADDLIVALQDLRAGDSVSVDDELFTVVADIPAKHKFLRRDVAKGEKVTMYGVTVGEATEPVAKGGLAGTHNIRHAASGFSGKQKSVSWTPPEITDLKELTFDGYHRNDGSVGTANHWLVVPLVFCENRNLGVMREAMLDALGYGKSSPYKAFVNELLDCHQRKGDLSSIQLGGDSAGSPKRPFPNVDGIKFLEHGLGCGGTREDAETLCGLLAGYCVHPNVAGITVLSLGCQNAQVSLLESQIGKRTGSAGLQKPFLVFEQQKFSSEQEMLSQALRDTFEGLVEANKLQRLAAPLSELVLGVECGGSDGFSGISANPVIGQVSNFLVALGGRVILSEFPELCGVEQSLADRCIDDATANRFVELMKRYYASAESCGSAIHMNPSPGNIADGLITDAIKSAGAAKKGGTSPVVDVLDYPERCKKEGLTLLCSPGNDVESTTAMAGAGATLMLFSTGLGTPTGNPITPTLKISSNTRLAESMSDIIDFDTGEIITGSNSISELGSKLFNLCRQTASGDYLCHAVRLGQDDFLPWKRGVSL